jgi:hypothetical protein
MAKGKAVVAAAAGLPLVLKQLCYSFHDWTVSI